MAARRPARTRQRTRSPRSTRKSTRRERRNLQLLAFTLVALAGVSLGVSWRWWCIPVAALAIAFTLAFRWPTLCRAHRTDRGVCEATVNGWLTGCEHHVAVKWRDLRAVLWPPNEVSPFHRAALAVRIPAREAYAQAILDGAPRHITLRNLATAMVLVISFLLTVLGIALG
ncbi:hypothetical protein [Frankia sp. AgB32]|uniref:hypothetical protein n=1 Tax=Frankia sp. AgB32 TaxID=631119 RepID=UPI00200BDD05|nr:hypothetical protein [Frankia sp. AgB32]MCK9894441.1 hypothetical protein [Frankia sp. AgB32]